MITLHFVKYSKYSISFINKKPRYYTGFSFLTLNLRLSAFNFNKCYAPININSLNDAPPDAHLTPEPVVCKYIPDVPVDPFAVKVPVNVALLSVSPAIVVTVAPEAIDVDPRVGAEYPATVAQESVPAPSVVRYLPELDA